MFDRLLAVVLALVLALPLFVSLDGDLFAPHLQPDATDAKQTESALPEYPSAEGLALEEEVMTREAMEAARRFSELAVEAMERQAQGLEDTVTWRSAPIPAAVPRPASTPHQH